MPRLLKPGLTLLLLAALLSGSWLLGCSSLCTKHLYIYRDTPAKRQAPGQMALLITNPHIAQAIIPQAGNYLTTGCRWAPEQLAQESDAYRLSMDKFDGQAVYQGLCMDSTPTYACEVRPGSRQVQFKLELFGPWGRENLKEEARVTLEPGKAYFLGPDCGKLGERQFVLQAVPLPEPYTPELRSRLVAWERQHSPGRGLED
ncbi:MAG: hypothetical protein ACOZF2_00680 [Thermodesulfobacteriota bacterium]